MQERQVRAVMESERKKGEFLVKEKELQLKAAAEEKERLRFPRSLQR